MKNDGLKYDINKNINANTDCLITNFSIIRPIIDYVLIDYLILVAYENLLPVKEMIDALPSNNVDIFDMYQVLNCPYSDELWSQLTATTVMHKLTYKMDLVKKTKDGQETLYQHMLKRVNS